MPDDNSSAPAPVSPTPTLPAVAVADDAPATNAPSATDVPDAPASTTSDAPAPAVKDAPVSDTVVKPDTPANPATEATPAVKDKIEVNTEIPAEVAQKIGESHNVLVALSSDPSVDEIAAAIGLSLYLDRLGKRATAIYSGQTPNALEFLKPEETFEDSVDALQDFVIALNKEKADHLRYKLDGDYVKIFITPYKSKIVEEDLEFSYGDYNVDLVLALDVANGVDLDAALREHGRIMHDAVIINITTGNPGKLGEIEWSDKSASSVSEMIATLLYSVNSKIKIEKEEATAFLTGIVAATNRFSNAGTTPATMRLASKLMESGANQQLVSKNITPDIENELFGMPGVGSFGEAGGEDADPTKLDIQHGNEEGSDEGKEVSGTVTEKESTLLDELKAAEASLAAAGAETTPEAGNKPLEIDGATGEDLPEVANEVKEEANHDANVMSAGAESEPTEPVGATESAGASEPASANEPAIETTEPVETKPESATEEALENPENSENPSEGFISDKPEKVIQPSTEMNGLGLADVNESAKYGQMLENALAGIGEATGAPDTIASAEPATGGGMASGVMTDGTIGNPAMASAPAVATNPEINGVPEINYMPMPGEEVLPPPPAPPIDMNAPVPTNAMTTPIMPATPIEPAAPIVSNATEPLGAQPAMQDQVYGPQATDPSAFKIPGM